MRGWWSIVPFVVATLAAGGVSRAAATSQVKGSVQGPDGKEASGVSLRLVPVTVGRIEREATSDAKGRFTIPLVEQGDYRLELTSGQRIGKIKVQVRNQGRMEESYDLAGGAEARPELEIPFGRVVQLEVDLASDEGAGRAGETPYAEARRLWAEKRYAESNAALDRLHEGADANAAYLRGLNALGLGQADDAVDQFRKAIELDPVLKGVRGQLAAALHERGDRRGAAALLGQELELDPANKDVATNLAIVVTELGEAEPAVAAWKRVLELSPDNVLASQELARLLTDLGRVEEAKDVLNRAEATGRPDPAFWFNIGANLSNEDKFEEAEAGYRKALAIDPVFPPAHREIGYLLLRKGDNRGAVEHLQAYLEASPKAADAAEVRDIVKGLREGEKK